MPIITDTFGGMLPLVEPHRIPDGNASIAKNCDLRWGGIRALPDKPASPTSAESISGDIFTMRKYNAPTVDSFRDVVNRSIGINLDVAIWVSWYYPSGSNWVYNTEEMTASPDEDAPVVTVSTPVWENAGLIRIPFSISKSIAFFGSGLGGGYSIDGTVVPTAWSISGPLFQCTFSPNGVIGDTPSNDGFPTADGTTPGSVTLGNNTTAGSPGAMRGAVPIIFDGDTVAYIQYEGARFKDVSISGTPDVAAAREEIFLEPQSGEVYFRVEYIYDKERAVYYAVSSLYKEDASDAEYEGPLSDRSEEIIVPQGSRPILTVTEESAASGGPSDAYTEYTRFYRAAGAASGLGRLKDEEGAGESGSAYDEDALIAGAQWTDNVLVPEGFAPPATGNLPSGAAADALLHPGMFGVTFSGSVLYVSEIFQLHAWPEEYSIDLGETIKEIEVVGSGIAVFTTGSVSTGSVYWVSGGSPSSLGLRLLTKEYFYTLPDKQGMTLDGSTLYYTAQGALCAISGGTLSPLTLDYFDRAAYVALGIERVRSREGLVWFYAYTDASNESGYILQSGPGGANLVQYDLVAAAKAIQWKSKQWIFENPKYIDVLQTVGLGTVDATLDSTPAGDATHEVTIYHDASTTTVTPTDDEPSVLALDAMHRFQFEVTDPVDTVAFYDAPTISTEENSLVFSAPGGDTPMAWARFRAFSPVPMQFSAARVTATKYPVTLTLTSNPVNSSSDMDADGAETTTITVSDGEAFRLPRFERSKNWRVYVGTSGTTPEDTSILEVRLATSMARL